ncbi:MAG TPA: diguanylate cyclase [Marinagarivorans sp.]
MTEDINGKHAKTFNASVATLLVLLLSVANLIGIALGAQEVISPFPFSPPMSLLSAVTLFLLSGALGLQLLQYFDASRLLSRLAIIASPLFLGLDGLIADSLQANLLPSSTLLTPIALLMISFLVLTGRTLPQTHITLYDAILTAFTLIPLLSVFAYIFDPVAMYNSYNQWVLPVPTAAGLLLTFFALVSQTNSKGAAGLLTRNSHYARNFQWLFMLVLIVPLSIGSSLALAIDLGYLRAGFGAAIFCLFTTLLIATVLANNAIVQENWLKKFVREQRKNSQLQNHISEVLELSPDAILLLDKNLKVLHANHGAALLFGWDKDELQNIGFGTLIPGEQFSRFERLILQFFRSPRLSLRASRPINILIQNRLGQKVPASLNLSKRQATDATHIVAVLRNNSDIANKIFNLEQQLKLDTLTGACSRTEFENHCAKLSRSQRKDEKRLAVFILDIDNFKAINDTYGHPTGDRVLQTFSQTTLNCLREGDKLFRIGGEEFAVVASNIDAGGALLLADRIRTIIKAKPMVAGPKNLYVTCSIGVCLTVPQDIDFAISEADKALYRAKRNGKDQVIAVE